MAKKRISKATKRRLSLLGPIFIIAIIYFIFSLFYNTYTIYSLTKEKNRLENLYIELQEESEQLKNDIEKLNDPEYLADYARENYRYSKPGEYIIQLEETEDIVNDISSEINKNYIIITLSIVMLMVFIYILSKGKKKKKRRN